MWQRAWGAPRVWACPLHPPDLLGTEGQDGLQKLYTRSQALRQAYNAESMLVGEERSPERLSDWPQVTASRGQSHTLNLSHPDFGTPIVKLCGTLLPLDQAGVWCWGGRMAVCFY